MATVMTRPPVARARMAFRIYVPIAILVLAIAIAGFWPTFFGPFFLEARPHALPIINFHAAVFTGWVVLLITQVYLAASGRVGSHMKVGRFVFLWGILVILTGWVTTFVRAVDHVQGGEVARGHAQLFVGFTDMLFFAAFLLAAWIYRPKPEMHKRLIVVACTCLLIAAVHRMAFLGGRPPPWPQLLAVWLSPILVAMAYDLIKRRLVHPVYLTGILAILAMKWGRGWIAHSETWNDLATWVTSFNV